MSLVLPLEPPYLVDLLLYFQRLEVVELGFVRLERRVHVVFAFLGDALLRRRVPLENLHILSDKYYTLATRSGYALILMTT